MEHLPDILCGALAVYFVGELVLAMQMGEPVGVRSRWSGLGSGTGGGWTVSRPAVYLLLVLVFALSAVAVHASHPAKPVTTGDPPAKTAKK